MTLRVVVVDDEAIARRRLLRLIRAAGGAEVVGEAGDGGAALAAVERTRPDVVLLDVQMPGLDGLAVAARLGPPRPLVIFVTAFDQYALSAFEVHAVDYLLKPVARERLAGALAHARDRFGRGDPALEALIRDMTRRPAWLTRLPVRLEGRVEMIDVAAIDWIEAAGNHVVVHAGRRTHVLRDTLTRLARQLDPGRFIRIHRSTIVQLDRVVHLDAATRGDYDVTLRDGTALSLSRTYRAELERAVGRPL
jgi:two-component system LytT family response regulator